MARESEFTCADANKLKKNTAADVKNKNLVMKEI